jgi:hypothetical protein
VPHLNTAAIYCRLSGHECGPARSLPDVGFRPPRRLYAADELGIELANSVSALDSTPIDWSLALFGWADFRATKAGVKMHTQLDLRGPIPTAIDVAPARRHDVCRPEKLAFEPGVFYLMDRGYVDFARLARMAAAGAFFVIRAKDNLRFARSRPQPIDRACGLRSDPLGKLALADSRAAIPWPLRKVRFFDGKPGASWCS